MKRNFKTALSALIFGLVFFSCKVNINMDLTAPQPVENLNAVLEDGKIVITWKDPIDQDLIGVKIYNGEPVSRGAADFGDGVLIGKGVQRYESSNFEDGKTYIFKVSAVDKALNESTIKKTSPVTFVAKSLKAGTYNICHLKQNVNGGREISDYILDETENGKSVEAGSTIESLKKNYEGFSALSIVQLGESVYIFYDRNTITYTFDSGLGKFKDNTTSKSVSGLYGSSFSKPKNPVLEVGKFVGWVDSNDEAVPDVFGAEDKTFVPEWKDKVNPNDGFVELEFADNDFAIATTETTYAQWYEVYQWAVENGYVFHNLGRAGNLGKDGEIPDEKNNQPVTNISWRDAVVWCNAASEKVGLTPVYEYDGVVLREAENYSSKKGTNSANTSDVKSGDGKAEKATINLYADGYRLPSEAEWEFAAKGGDDFIYSGSDNLDDVAWYSDNTSKASAQDVQTKAANGYGLYDMSGNVWEWCQNLYLADSLDRTVRGGSYFGDASTNEISSRDKKEAAHHWSSGGFRAVRSID